MTTQIETSTEGRLGVITLNRPEALNALSGEMIGIIAAQLEAWRGDPAINAVLFEGRGTRGFCSGGDVRAVRAMIADGHPEAADAYFATEYRLNEQIAGYPKPVVVLAHGFVMGGGIGIAGHARYRFFTADAQYAMPETAIGLVSDIGVNWILSKAPENRALLFLMSGLPAAGADVLALGLGDCCYAADQRASVRAGIVSVTNSTTPEAGLATLMESIAVQAGERRMCDLADEIDDILALPTAAEIVAGIAREAEHDARLVPYAEQLGKLSPTSLEAVVISHRRARRMRNAGEVLALDLRLASLLARLPDFAEGVRAQLIDKDRAPKWSPADFAGVDREALKAAADGP